MAARMISSFTGTITAKVIYAEDGKAAKCKVVSKITIYVGGQLAASTTLGGRYSQVQAIAEFKKNSQRFVPLAAFAVAKERLAMA